RAEKLHAEDIWLLAGNIDAAHVDMAFQTKQGGNRRAGNPMLACTSFSDNTLFAHALRQPCLSQRVIDLVRPGVCQILALEVNLRAAEFFRQAFGIGNWGRSAGVIGLQLGQLLLKGGIAHRLVISGAQFIERRDERLRYEAPAKFAKVAALVRDVGGSGGDIWSSHQLFNRSEE